MRYFNVTIVSTLFILFNACGKPSVSIDDFSVIQKIADYDSIYSDKNDAPLGMIGDIEIIDNILIVRSIDDDHFFALIDVDKGELLTKWGMRGQGPGEYVELFRFTISENRLVFLDRGKREINYVPLSTILKPDSAANIIKETCPVSADFRPRYLTLVGDKKIIAGSFKEGHFGFLDAENKIVDHPFDFPFTYSQINGIYKGSTFQSEIKSNNKQQKFVVSIFCSDIFEIYQVSGTNIVRTYISPFNHIPKITKRSREYSPYGIDYYNSIRGLRNLAVSDDFICFSYSSKKYEEMTNQGFNEILCFNWEGEKIKKYILPFPIHSFCIDNNYIYGVRYYDDDIVFYRFNMNDVLEDRTPTAKMHLVNKHTSKTEIVGKEMPYAFGQTDSTIYETGKSLTSCECNFENLFANWGPRFITNHDDIQLLSYSYVETLTDTGRVALYAEKLSDPETVSARCESKSHGDENTQGVMIREFRIFPNMITIPPGKEKEAQLEFQRMKGLFMEFIHVGDRVYEIKIKYVGSEYTAYAFCRPGENRVVFDNWKFMDMRELYSDLCE